MAIGTSPPASSPAFHTDDPGQTTEYRTLSVLAIISLILGLASPLCFAAPLLMVIPIAGIAISILALRRIAASEGTLAGSWAAVTGLILCVVFAVAPIARGYVLKTLRTQQAEEFARSWISSFLAGKVDYAFRLTSDSTRPPQHAPGEEPPKTSPLDTFKALPLVQAIAGAGPDADVRFHGTVSYEPQSFYRVYVRQRFEIIPKSTGNAQPVDLLLTVQRAKLGNEGRTRWLVVALEDANKPATPQ